MSTITATSGSDTWVRDDRPYRNLAGGPTIRLQASHRNAFVHVPITDVRGRTVLSATLRGHVRSGFAAQTVTVAAVATSWAAGKTTWANQPGVAGASVSTVLGALSDGAAATLDVTAIVQSVANGAAWRGVRLTTSAATADTSNWYAFDSSQPAWVLTVELSDAPEQPSDLRPNVGAIASSRPILGWSYTDLGGDSSEQGAFKVQVDPAANSVTPAFDSGWITSATPQYDLSTSSVAALASGASTQWRVMTRDAAGNASAWSDWASYTYKAYPTLTMDSPTGGVIGDSTPDIIAHLTGETLTQWRARVLDSTGEVLWSSGLSDGAIAITVPKRNRRGERVIRRDDATYTIEVRAWGDVDRAPAIGKPAYVQVLTNVVFDDDAGVITPGDFTVTPASLGDPRATFTWTRTAAPEAVKILDGNTVYARLDSDDWTLSAGTYTWTDGGLSDPFTQHDFTIRAIETVGGRRKRSHASSVVHYTPRIIDVWLVPDGMFPIRLEGGRGSLDQFATTDRRAVYKPLNTGKAVSIVYAFEGASGTFTGTLSPRQNQTAAVARLAALRADVAATPRLVWGVSIPVQLGNLKCLPAADFTEAQPVYNVSFDFIQAGD